MSEILEVPENFQVPTQKKKYRLRINRVRYILKKRDRWYIVTFKKHGYKVEVTFTGGSYFNITRIKVNGYDWRKVRRNRWDPDLPSPVIKTVNGAMAQLQPELLRLTSQELDALQRECQKQLERRQREDETRRTHFQKVMEALQ